MRPITTSAASHRIAVTTKRPSPPIAQRWKNAAEAVRAFGPGGRHHPTHDALVAELRADLRARSPITVLVKGSRSMGMESVVQALGGRC